MRRVFVSYCRNNRDLVNSAHQRCPSDRNRYLARPDAHGPTATLGHPPLQHPRIRIFICARSPEYSESEAARASLHTRINWGGRFFRCWSPLRATRLCRTASGAPGVPVSYLNTLNGRDRCNDHRDWRRKWVEKASVGAVSMFFLWPVAVTAGFGAWEQAKTPTMIFDYIGSRLAYK
jgi:hypothetical protein